MTEEPAPRAPHAPQATQTPAPARGEGAGPDRPPQGDTALRERLDAALRTVGLARNLAAYRDAVLPVVEAETAALRDTIERIRELTEQPYGAVYDLAADIRAEIKEIR